MTQSISTIFEKVSSLPPEVQDEIAVYWSEDLDSELQWDTTLKNSISQLELIAEKAIKDYENGKTVRKGFDEL
ncbi:MAG: hypothetical protein EPN82_08260 [Bacteroidetes bacterium]|nr:MAG: hypothetical protein EPN82_08260 [Bacteroidota bacterium]